MTTSQANPQLQINKGVDHRLTYNRYCPINQVFNKSPATTLHTGLPIASQSLNVKQCDTADSFVVNSRRCKCKLLILPLLHGAAHHPDRRALLHISPTHGSHNSQYVSCLQLRSSCSFVKAHASSALSRQQYSSSQARSSPQAFRGADVFSHLTPVTAIRLGWGLGAGSHFGTATRSTPWSKLAVMPSSFTFSGSVKLRVKLLK